MGIDFDKLIELLESLEEVDQTEEYLERKKLIGILSGNKNCIMDASLEDLAYYIENFESILGSQGVTNRLNIQFLMVEQAQTRIRRGI